MINHSGQKSHLNALGMGAQERSSHLGIVNNLEVKIVTFRHIEFHQLDNVRPQTSQALFDRRHFTAGFPVSVPQGLDVFAFLFPSSGFTSRERHRLPETESIFRTTTVFPLSALVANGIAISSDGEKLKNPFRMRHNPHFNRDEASSVSKAWLPACQFSKCFHITDRFYCTHDSGSRYRCTSTSPTLILAVAFPIVLLYTR
ncbi:hypothetical protein M514_00967 [Trichuris suis]|uniref:Uncharacterized protein n=1 Tax=Trichuris suis TaxID=68888 RepID=A0A085NLX2_9BILA|nr:hypothetical protein M513_00967 [Trichuris suis]KFD70468.1 hypothetical protein M514_00967 [Trichuris suis]